MLLYVISNFFFGKIFFIKSTFLSFEEKYLSYKTIFLA